MIIITVALYYVQVINIISSQNDPVRNCSCDGIGVGSGCNFQNVYCSPVDNNCNKALEAFNAVLLTLTENVALGKVTSHSSVSSDHGKLPGNGLDRLGCLAVNGNRSIETSLKRINCHHDGRQAADSFWTVDLGRNYTVTNVTVYSAIRYSWRMNQVLISVDNKFCYKFPTAAGKAPDVYHISCSNPVIGRFLTLSFRYNPEKSAHLLNFCEVEVWVCKSGFYGQSCTETCSANCIQCDNYDGTCTKDGCIKGFYGTYCSSACGQCKNGECDQTGKCTLGCQNGWTGGKCDQECAPGFYGANCAQKCPKCGSGLVCSRINGTCLAKCDIGFQGSSCNEHCNPGSWGIGCSQTCGHCYEKSRCHHISGGCLEGCEKGWQSQYCNESCTPGTFGYSCQKSCGKCKNGNPCYVINGTCPDGCEEGWRLADCSLRCPLGTYGHDCKECGKCLAESCNPITGMCPESCESGWKEPPYCNQTCDVGTYGDNCGSSCGRCLDNICLVSNGTCLLGCQEGYQGIECLDKDADLSIPVYYYIVGSVLAVVLLGVILCILIVCRRRTRKHSTKQEIERDFHMTEEIQLKETDAKIEEGQRSEQPEGNEEMATEKSHLENEKSGEMASDQFNKSPVATFKTTADVSKGSSYYGTESSSGAMESDQSNSHH